MGEDFIAISEPDLNGNELRNVTECVTSGWISSAGKYVATFEDRFAAWCGATEGVATMNGTAALHLALHAMGIGPGDEVIVPTLTFAASPNAVRYTGARPVFVDSEYETWNLDPVDVRRRITSRTKAIMPVHLYGQPANMQPILRVALEHDLLVLEDAAEAHGAEVGGQRVGGLGDAGAFSFYGNKILTTGEGGMVVTADKNRADRMRFLRDHAMTKDRRYWHDEIGFNYRMTNLQAAIGLAQLERVDWFLTRKRQIASRYRSVLDGVPGLTMPPDRPWSRSAHWMFSMLIDEKKFGIDRDAVVNRLLEVRIETRRFFYPMHTMPMYATDDVYPVAEDLAARGINLPSSVRLSDKEVDRVSHRILELAAGTHVAISVKGLRATKQSSQPSWAGVVVAVTGGTGFLGRHLVDRLLSSGAKVRIVDDSSAPNARMRSDALVIRADVRDARATYEAIRGAEVIFHLAAISDPRICESDPSHTFDINVQGTNNVLRAAHTSRRVVFLSSAAVYGHPLCTPIRETHPLSGTDPYARSKMAAEQVCLMYSSSGLPITIVRDFNTFGPGQKADFLIPQVIEQAMVRRKVEIWSRGPIRDFLYVDDLVDALMVIAQTETAAGETVNVGSGVGVAIGEVVDAVIKLLAVPLDCLDRPVKSPDWVADTTKLYRLTGWRPRVSLAEGLKQTIAFYELEASPHISQPVVAAKA